MLERLGHIPPAEAEKAYYASIVSANNAGWNDKAVQEIVRIPTPANNLGVDSCSQVPTAVANMRRCCTRRSAHAV
ncbi:TPA: hypothetical protein N8F85_005100 [Escherichia coli]|nr:hypothetical protein [Escherichia coli]EMV27904.1 hypothetical protein ECBCE034MS14_5397 [Escherichia coli BCE034_MS-14]EMV50438.1 hypothetical protein EC2871950_5172 [Escherichia coli 2871950]EMV50671.1 hypothetical protein EC2872000_5197 [Escherichia coli 2872000]EMX96391.1 hypothetical protein EC2720900_0481 [Escherichia coli 2720900]EMZ59805.1 hypothetical protein EC2846750_4857 [Escherichia coli 2846750]KDA60256.1 hypothetical protein AA98_5334 [Escherichia coli 2-011-08_S1_C1]KDU223